MHPVHSSSFSQPAQAIEHESVQPAATESGCCGWMGSILERIASAFTSAFKWVQSLFCGSSRSSEAPSSVTPPSIPSQAASTPLVLPRVAPSRVVQVTSEARTEQFLNFYRGTGVDDQGRTLAQILAWDDRQLENVHNYIQWLFPNRRPSAFNAQAPLLNDTIIEAFANEPVLRQNLMNSFSRMLRFYGLELNEQGIVRASNAVERQAVWLTPGNHNYLRITRMLRCLRVLQLSETARSFHLSLDDIARHEGQGRIPDETLRIWHVAAQGTVITPQSIPLQERPAPLSQSRVTPVPTSSERMQASSIAPQSTSSQERSAPLSESHVTTAPIRPHVHFPEDLASGSHNPPEAFRRTLPQRQREAIPEAVAEVMASDRTQISLGYLRSLDPTHPLVQNRDEQLLNFYRGTGCDNKGRTLRQIVTWDDHQLESVHDYIQWLFPTYQPSEVNPHAPLLNESIVQLFRQEPVLRDNLIVSFYRMLRFYGLEESGLHEFRRAPNAAQRQEVWLTPDNHNYKHITRILLCLRATMGPGIAQRFLRILEEIAQNEGRGSISESRLQSWRGARIADRHRVF